jgi:hypothetical protein
MPDILNLFALFGIFELLFVLFFMFISLLGTIFWIWMIVDCATKEPSGTDKIVWIIIIVLTHFLGALIYFIFRRPERIKHFGR